MMMEGFRFGLMLQAAVGPVCIYIFQAAVSRGIGAGMAGVAGVTIVDALYIGGAILGMGRMLEGSEAAKRWIRTAGGGILVLFGVSSVWGSLSSSGASAAVTSGGAGDIFIRVMVLTLTNPLTLVFWLGVFSVKINRGERSLREMILFGSGAVMATLVFLSGVVAAGGYAGSFLGEGIVRGLNGAVGVILIYLGVKSIMEHYLPGRSKEDNDRGEASSLR